MEEKKLTPKKDDKGLYGFVDENGIWVIEPKFDDAWEFSEEDKESRGKFTEPFAWVKINGKWQLIDDNGNWAIGPGEKLGLFKGENDKWGMKVLTSGKIIFMPQYQEAFEWEDFLITTNEYDTVDIFTPQGLLEESFCDASVEEEYDRLVIWQDGDEWHFYPDGTSHMAVMEEEDENEDDEEEYDEDED